MTPEEVSKAREWIAGRLQYVETECRLSLARPEGAVVLADQARILWAKSHGALSAVRVLRRDPDTGKPTAALAEAPLGMDAAQPDQLDLLFGDLHLRLSEVRACVLIFFACDPPLLLLRTPFASVR